MEQAEYDTLLRMGKALGGPYGAGYCMGLRKHFHPHTYFLPESPDVLSDRARFGDRACGFMDGLAGKPPRPKAWKNVPDPSPAPHWVGRMLRR